MRPVRVGTQADTPHSLRAKAKEFLRLAGEASGAVAYEELVALATSYMQRALELEGASAPANAANDAEGTPPTRLGSMVDGRVQMSSDTK